MPESKILIIDDEQIIHDTLARTFRKESYEMYFAKNGIEGLEQIKIISPDVVLLDLKMPKMGGLAMLEELKLQADAPYSVIILTGHGGDEEMRKCFDLGVQSFLRKPINPLEVRGQVRQSLQLRGYQREIQALFEQRTSELRDTETKRAQAEMHLDYLNRAGSDFSDMDEVHVALNSTLERITSQTEFDQVGMYSFREESENQQHSELILSAFYPESKLIFEYPESIPVSLGIVSIALKSKKPIFVSDTSKNPEFSLTPDKPGMRALLAIPIIENDISIGMFLAIGVAGKAHCETQDLVFVDAISRMGMLAIKNATNLEIIRSNEQTLKARINEQTKSIQELLNNTGQGILTFGNDYLIHDEFSSLCATYLGTDIAGQHALTLLFNVDAEKGSLEDELSEVSAIKELMDMVFQGQKLFLFKDFFPKEIIREKQIFSIQYRFIKGADKKQTKMMILLDDITLERELSKQIEKEKEQHQMILRVALDRDGFLEFLRELDVQFTSIDAEFAKPLDQIDVNSILRCMHTVKGDSSSYGMIQLADYAHKIESEYEQVQIGDQNFTEELKSSFSKKTDVMRHLLKKALDTLSGTALEDELEDHQVMYRVSETTLSKYKNNLLTSLIESVTEEMDSFKNTPADKFKINLEKSYNSKLDTSLDIIRKQPMAPVLRRFATLARGLGERLGKPMEVNIKGGEIVVIHDHLASIFSVIIHLVRNAVSHGLEEPERRLMLQKPEVGTLNLSVELEENGTFIFKIEDDGQGINHEDIRDIAMVKEIITPEEAETLTKKELQELIFKPGFSTAHEVTSISGRGVGMDAVKSKVEEMNGLLTFESTLGKGSLFQITIPH